VNDLAQILPRLLTKSQAASYCSLSPSGFSSWVRMGRVPGPLKGTRRWDREALQACLDRASGLAKGREPDSAYDEWKRQRRSREAEPWSN